MSKTIFARSTGDPDKRSRQEIMDEKRRINYLCMDIRLNSHSTKEALKTANREGIVNRNGEKMTPAALMYRCQWALIDNPDRWRERIDAYDRKAGQKPLTDEEWDEHVIDNCVDFARYSSGHVFRLILSDPVRWGHWSHKWDGNPDFASLTLPTMIRQDLRRITIGGPRPAVVTPA